ncbi:MAG: NUDIX domain-containing protein [Candidatus Levybacteria bacterium]|nr:NUDIX domain-containing protein [Candidatus Levybacteria bacterium]
MIEGLESLVEPDIKRIYISAAQVILLRPDQEGEGEMEVLLGHRNTSSFSEQWAFFGGRKDPADADLVDTARREAMEELGIVVERNQLFPFRESLSVLSRIVSGRIVSREINLHSYILDARNLTPFNAAPDEHDRIGWFGLSSALRMHEAAIALHPNVSRLDRDSIPGALAPRTAETIQYLMGI